MKTVYMKPEIQVVEIVVEKMIAASVTVGGDVENGTTDANQKRGSWGDLWD